MSTIRNLFCNIIKTTDFPFLWIGDWVSEHVDKNRLRHATQQRECFLPLRAQFIDLIENDGNAALLLD
ncbi:hypothetical protein WJ47_30825 [Burkholderia ubonensis]|uniref:Uncharacterized protein n=1 Tax=Burkholderia ubonensis TaxID=101571 RepID=A0AB73FQN6_9BURK|nr:hypothetical protein WJ44_13180 [Burkholderia ubonensis]KVL78320.1 hypothetical protein WJ47_30825 [Burkholderia ubonensis]KVM19079.1 hypothetical protein WJ53_24940 [Burkholderia ubonensis]KVM26085.1 hypothetical protein WJ54_18790 [Burkholderia ubonensis]